MMRTQTNPQTTTPLSGIITLSTHPRKGDRSMPGFIRKFETTTPLKFKEKDCDTEFEVNVEGALYANEDLDPNVFGADRAAGINKLKEMAIDKLGEHLSHWHEGDKTLLFDGYDALGLCLTEFMAAEGISGSARIDNLKITDETNDAYQKQVVEHFFEFKKEKRRQEIEAAREPHGPLREFSYDLHSHGMMAGTSSGSTRMVKWNDDGSVIYSYRSQGGGHNVNMEYKITPEAASKVIDLVKEADIAALAKMEIETPVVFDNFTSTTILMVFDDSSLGGDSYNYCTLNCGAYGMTFGTLEKKVSALLDEIQESGELIKEEKTETPGNGMPGMLGMFGMMNNGGNKTAPQGEPPVQLMGLVQADPDAGKDFPTPTEWTCQCGMENSGKFCANCGSARP